MALRPKLREADVWQFSQRLQDLREVYRPGVWSATCTVKQVSVFRS